MRTVGRILIYRSEYTVQPTGVASMITPCIGSVKPFRLQSTVVSVAALERPFGSAGSELG